MKRSDRRAASSAYKEREPAFGVYAVICNATGEVWVGHSRHVETQKNGLWFSLKVGTSAHTALQAVWNHYGEENFRFEELERLRPDYPPLSRLDELKKRQGLWKARLKACDI